MSDAPTILVTDPDLAAARQAQAAQLESRSQRWLANQEKKARGSRSKYVPHQGAREIARRLREHSV